MPVIGWTVFLYVTSILVCNATGTVSTGHNPFLFITNIITFTLCTGVPAWFSVVLFASSTLPLLLLLFLAITPLFNNVVTGIAAGIGTVLAIAAVVIGFLF